MHKWCDRRRVRRTRCGVLVLVVRLYGSMLALLACSAAVTVDDKAGGTYQSKMMRRSSSINAPPAAPAYSGYDFKLYPEALARGTTRLAGTAALMRKLERGEAISVGVLGASVAQNGGCLNQPDSRCSSNDGIKKTTMAWGQPRVRPHRGFFVRWFQCAFASSRYMYRRLAAATASAAHSSRSPARRVERHMATTSRAAPVLQRWS